MTLKESEVLERIGMCVDDLDLDSLAELHNHVSNYEPIAGDDIKAENNWHLVPQKGA